MIVPMSVPGGFTDVGAVGDFPEGRARIVVVGEREVGILRWQGEWFALRNVCPHFGAPVCEGVLWPLLTQPSVTDPDLTVDPSRPVLVCPWHLWEFDLRSGVAVTGKERIKTYRVTVEDGRVKVALDRAHERQSAAKR